MKRSQLELEKLVMLDRLSKQFERIKKGRPKIDTGLGFSVQGGYQDVENLRGGRDLALGAVRASDNTMRPVSPGDWGKIMRAVQADGVQRFQKKWAIEEAIKNAPDLDTLRAIDTRL